MNGTSGLFFPYARCIMVTAQQYLRLLLIKRK